MQKIKELFITLLILMVTVEAFALIAIKFFKYTNIWYKYPTYTYWGPTVKESYDPLGPHYIDTDSVKWGTWHIPNTTIRHKGDCFDVNMTFNSIGARGPLPTKTDSNTTIFLGDSFIEGFALAENETIPAQYSKFKNVPTLNLGGGGSFGTTQMAMIYDSLSPSFKHKNVILCLYLDNDFIDDDINYTYKGRYRPYLVKDSLNQTFKVIYQDSLKNSIAKGGSYKSGQLVEKINKLSIADHFRQNDKSFSEKIFSFTYSARLFTELYYRAKAKNKEPQEVTFSQKSIDILRYNLQKIAKKAEANGAKLYVLNVPSKNLLFALNQKPEYKAKIDFVIKRNLAGQKFHYLDLTQHIIDKKIKLNDIYFDCDSHFNPKGAFVMAEYLLYHTNF